MLADVVSHLRCPHCRGALTLSARCVSCGNGHTFDVARHGYVSLLPGDARGDAGDSAAMVRAREQALAAGHYARLADLIAELAARWHGEHPAGCVVDAGAGTGYYLTRVVDRLTTVGLALDISKYACRRAARAHPRVGAVACDVWRPLPVADDAASLVLDVFAPRNGAEFHRVLRPDGLLLVVTPTPRHLAELVTPLGLLTVDEHKDDRVADTLGRRFEPAHAETHEQTIELTHDEAVAVAGMGPSAWHLSPDVLRRRAVGLPEPVPTTLSVTVAGYRPVR